MALFESVVHAASSSPSSAVLTLLLFTIFWRIIYLLFFHPLAKVPGPPAAKFTSLWLHYHAYMGDEASVIFGLHARYGPLVRVAPNHIDIADADSIAPIYVTGGGFPKSTCYENFTIDGHNTIFSPQDPAYRTPRAKAVVGMFSTAAIRASSALLYDSVNLMVTRLQREAYSGKAVNILNLTRSLAVDIVSTHLFQQNYKGTAEKSQRLSVSAFVDSFVAVGRFFYLPNWAFVWLEWVIEKIKPDENTYSSMEIVDKYVDELVDGTSKGDSNYPGRLMELSLEKSEIKAQCKDLIFAGTDSTGMNLATIFRYLAMSQNKLQRLYKEVASNAASSTPSDLASLPYLSAVLRESLRLSMANPTRLPHTVPASGWIFKGTYFPPGTDVGCSAYQLHLDPIAFPDPEAFIPERWLDDRPKSKEARERMNKNWFAFGAGSRACIARNLAMAELYMGTERVVLSGVLEGARPVKDKVEIFEWFNSSVKGEKIELIWDRKEKQVKGGADIET